MGLASEYYLNIDGGFLTNNSAALRPFLPRSLTAALVVVVSSFLLAQTPASKPDTTPSELRIKKTIRLVEVEVIAKDKKGQPITDLAERDFSLKDNGQKEQIRFFSTQQQRNRGNANAAESSDHKSGSAPTEVFSNSDAGSAPPVVMLMDLLNTPADNQPALKSAVVASLNRLHSNAPIALLSLGEELKVVSDFTTDASSIAALLEKPTAARPEGVGPEITAEKSSHQKFNDAILKSALLAFSSQNAAEFERTVAALNLIRTQFSLMRGRKSLVWIGGGLSVGPHDWPQVKNLIEQLNDADVGVYTVDARGLVTDYGTAADITGVDMLGPWKEDQADTRGDILGAIAQDTGGVPYRNRNDLDRAITRALEDNTTVYTLGYYPQHNDWQGKAHKIEVKVARGGVNLRYRSGYIAAPESAPEATNQQSILQAVAASPPEFPGIRFSVEMKPREQKEEDEKSGNGVNLILHVPASELRLSSQNDKSMGALQVWLIQRQPTGEDLTSKTSSFGFQLSPTEFESAVIQGITFTFFLKLKETTAKVRVLLRDNNSGRIGTVDVPVDTAAIQEITN